MLITADQRVFDRTKLSGKDTASLLVNEPALTVEMILQVLPHEGCGAIQAALATMFQGVQQCSRIQLLRFLHPASTRAIGAQPSTFDPR
jgi:carbonic anhydrase